MDNELLHKIHEDVAYLRGKFDSIVPGLVDGQARHGERLGKLEHAESYRKGQSAVISFLISFIGVAINFILGKK